LEEGENRGRKMRRREREKDQTMLKPMKKGMFNIEEQLAL
jgi:hypothetical protein